MHVVSRTWEKAAWTAAGLAALYLAGCLYRLVFTVHEASTLTSLLATRPPDALDRITALQSTEESLTFKLLLALVAMLVSYLVFLRMTKHTLEEEGVEPKEAMRHWGIVAWRIAIWLNLLVSLLLNPTVTSAADIQRAALMTELSLGLRCVSVAALLVGIHGLRVRIRERLAAVESRRRNLLLQGQVAP